MEHKHLKHGDIRFNVEHVPVAPPIGEDGEVDHDAAEYVNVECKSFHGAVTVATHLVRSDYYGSVIIQEERWNVHEGWMPLRRAHVEARGANETIVGELESL